MNTAAEMSLHYRSAAKAAAACLHGALLTPLVALLACPKVQQLQIACVQRAMNASLRPFVDAAPCYDRHAACLAQIECYECFCYRRNGS